MFKPLWCILFQNNRCNWPEIFPVLYLVESCLHGGVYWRCQYGPAAKCPWSELHSSLEPSNDFIRCKNISSFRCNICQPPVFDLGPVKKFFKLFIGVGRSPIHM